MPRAEVGGWRSAGSSPTAVLRADGLRALASVHGPCYSFRTYISTFKTCSATANTDWGLGVVKTQDPLGSDKHHMQEASYLWEEQEVRSGSKPRRLPLFL